MQEASKDDSKRERGAKVEYGRILGNHLPQYNTSWTNTGEVYRS